MTHKNYVGFYTFDTDVNIYHGEVIYKKDIITFQGKSINDLKIALEESITDYLIWCVNDGIVDEKRF